MPACMTTLRGSRLNMVPTRVGARFSFHVLVMFALCMEFAFANIDQLEAELRKNKLMDLISIETASPESGSNRDPWCNFERWREMIYCDSDMENDMPTDYRESTITNLVWGGFGGFTTFLIDARDKNGNRRTAGGDTWVVAIADMEQEIYLVADIVDNRNGTYTAAFIIMEAGNYQIQIRLDYTLCNGFQDPPDDWYQSMSPQWDHIIPLYKDAMNKSIPYKELTWKQRRAKFVVKVGKKVDFIVNGTSVTRRPFDPTLEREKVYMPPNPLIAESIPLWGRLPGQPAKPTKKWCFYPISNSEFQGQCVDIEYSMDFIVASGQTPAGFSAASPNINTVSSQDDYNRAVQSLRSATAECPRYYSDDQFTSPRGRWIKNDWLAYYIEIGNIDLPKEHNYPPCTGRHTEPIPTSDGGERKPQRGLFLAGDSTMSQFQHAFCGAHLHHDLQLCNCMYRSVKIGEGESSTMLSSNGRSQMKYSPRTTIMMWKNFVSNGKGKEASKKDKEKPMIQTDGGVIILNVGLHYNARLGFPIYRRVLQEFVDVLQENREVNKVLIPIWKQTTATQRYVYTKKTCGAKLDSIVYHGAIRWLTNSRTQAYNAYARTLMRKLNITIIDHFWQSFARPKGLYGDEKSTDAVHHSAKIIDGYNPYAYRRICEALQEEFPKDIKANKL